MSYQYECKSECPIYTILKYFSFLSLQNCSLLCVLIHFIPTHSLFHKNSFLFFGFHFTHAHTQKCVVRRKPISGKNLHIIGKWDKLWELSRVPTCYTNMNAIWMSYSYHFKILFFSFCTELFTTMRLDSFYSYSFFIS